MQLKRIIARSSSLPLMCVIFSAFLLRHLTYLFIFSKFLAAVRLLDSDHTDLILLSLKQTITLFSWVSSPYDV